MWTYWKSRTSIYRTKSRCVSKWHIGYDTGADSRFIKMDGVGFSLPLSSYSEENRVGEGQASGHVRDSQFEKNGNLTTLWRAPRKEEHHRRLALTPPEDLLLCVAIGVRTVLPPADWRAEKCMPSYWHARTKCTRALTDISRRGQQCTLGIQRRVKTKACSFECPMRQCFPPRILSFI